jgi:hypothetical protein
LLRLMEVCVFGSVNISESNTYTVTGSPTQKDGRLIQLSRCSPAPTRKDASLIG